MAVRERIQNLERFKDKKKKKMKVQKRIEKKEGKRKVRRKNYKTREDVKIKKI